MVGRRLFPLGWHLFRCYVCFRVPGYIFKGSIFQPALLVDPGDFFCLDSILFAWTAGFLGIFPKGTKFFFSYVPTFFQPFVPNSCPLGIDWLVKPAFIYTVFVALEVKLSPRTHKHTPLPLHSKKQTWLKGKCHFGIYILIFQSVYRISGITTRIDQSEWLGTVTISPTEPSLTIKAQYSTFTVNAEYIPMSFPPPSTSDCQ